jgi:hypothetical protein
MEVGFLLVGAAAGVALVEVVVRRTDVGAAIVLGLVLLGVVFPELELTIVLGPVNIGPNDLLFVLLLTAAIARLLRLRELSTAQRLLIFLGILVAWAVIRGADPHGVPAAVNEGRRSLRFVATALYFSTLEPERDLLQRIGRIWLITAAALCSLALVRWLGNAAGVSGGLFGSGGTLRVLNSDQTLIVAQGALLALPLLVDRSRGLLRYLAPGLLVFVLLLQHRTVWIVAAAGSAYLLYRERGVAKRMLPALVAAILLLGGLVFTVFGDDVSEQLADSAQSTGTFEWRVDGWVALLNHAREEGGAEELTVGRPFGTGWSRVMPNGHTVEVSPHNYYIEAFLRVGFAGLVAFIWLYALILRGTAAASRLPAASSALLNLNSLHTAVAMQLVYYLTYAPDVAQAMLFGIGCAVAGSFLRSRPAATDHRSVAPR